MLYSINLKYFIVWLYLLLEKLSNMCPVIICFPGNDVMNFEINIGFPIKLFDKSRQKLKYLKNRRSSLDRI